ncbi:MAG TPA: DNA mismatch repair endonuclease MutL [Planctomycetota bacterium]|nr:DNA mismatch repair endonuclease MutL [Planctomycetota bacterium]HPY75560.1 DNA mismatch repair endonuclease MutL [Planctomycetota bacterium]HQB01154.1 DNA mismatch repair endonuclease MutL [Planctomycetota bacterium]
MSKIKKLSPILINQIAAGECIERPSSVVKELVENSIDAGATDIKIEIQDAGNSLIQIMDNGCGMNEDDLKMALVSHATSKLTNADDLFNIHTLGFRGEALASIASIAEVTISSATQDTETGSQITTKNGQVQNIQPVAMNQGTKIQVHDLFFNVPARRKFLKAKSTEMAHITETIIQLVMAYPNIQFLLTHDGKKVLQVEQSDSQKIRIQQLIGTKDIDYIYAEHNSLKYSIQAYLAPPNHVRSNSKMQYCYINQRSIRDRIILKALQDAYSDYLPNKKFAIAVLFLQIHPLYLDVNVHPAKAEVRHRDSQEIYRLVYQTVKKALQGENFSVPISLPESKITESEKQASSWIDSQEKQNQSIEQTKLNFIDPTISTECIKNNTIDTQNKQKNLQNRSMPSHDFNHLAPTSNILPADILTPCSQLDNVSEKKIYFPPLPPAPDTTEDITFSKKQKMKKNQDLKTDDMIQEIHDHINNFQTQQQMPFFPPQTNKYKIINSVLQVHNTYLILETLDNIQIIDQHALHERILYEELSKQIQNGKLIIQSLLFPYELNVLPEEMELYEQYKSFFKRAGLEIIKKDEKTLEIKALPQILGKFLGETFFRDLLEQLHQGNKSLEDPLDKILATMACKSAIKAGDKLTPEEINNLLQAQETLQNPYHCPHGRPTTLNISIQELEKYFLRV